MANPSRDKGTKGESAVVEWWHQNGETRADRHTLHGNRDIGDIKVDFDLVHSVKWVGKGQPMALSKWLNDLEVMKHNHAARYNPGGEYPAGLLTVRRALYPNVDDWYAVMRMADWWANFRELLT